MRKMNKPVSIVLCMNLLLTMLFGFAGSAHAVEPTSIVLQPSKTSLTTNEIFTVTVKIVNTSAVEGVVASEVYLTYDHTLLELQDSKSDTGIQVQDGTILTGNQYWWSWNNNGAGKINYVGSRLAGNNGVYSPVTPFKGDSSLFVATFKALGAGTPAIHLDSAKTFLTDQNSNYILYNTPADVNLSVTAGTPVQQPINPPTNVTATVDSDTQVTLNWVDNSNNEDGFRIYDTIGIIRGTVGANATSYTETNLMPNTTYTRIIKPYNAQGEGIPSYQVTFTTMTVPPTTVPAAPSGLAAAAASSSQINLTWVDNSNNESGFKIYDSGNMLKGTVGAGATSYNVTGLTPGTAYTFYVKAYNAAGESSASNQSTATTQANTTPPPVGGGGASGGGGGGGAAPAPTPVSNIEKTVPDLGGKVTSEDNTVIVDIPQGALDPGVSLKLTAKMVETANIKIPVPEGLKLASDTFEFGPAGKLFNKPVKITLKYKADFAGDVAPYYLNETRKVWEFIQNATVNTVDRTVTFETTHFSKYAVMGKPTEPVVTKTFDDITNHWAKAVIEEIATKGIVNGKAVTQFDPDGKVTRAEFARMLVGALGLEPQKGKIAFTDVNEGDWYVQTVDTAVYAGIIKGYSDGAFKPNNKVTRQEMAVMIINALAYKNKELADDENVLATFTDNVKVSEWAKTGLAKAVNAKIVNGRTVTTLAPLDNATRAEAAVMIKKLLDMLK